jgi:chitin-binding protein
MQRKGTVLALFVGVMLVSSLVSTDVAFGHGWITSPPSRQDHCAKGRTPFDCGQVRYEPQSVEAAKGAMSCSGGSSFTILDNHSLAWPVTNGSNTTTFTWTCTACHVTRDWEYFVNGTLLRRITGSGQAPNPVSHSVSGIPGGRQRVLGRWNIGDTAAAFYACVDLQVGGGGGGTPTPTPNPTSSPTPAPSATPAPTNPPPTSTPTSGGGGGGTWAPNTFYAVGATVTYGGASYRCAQAHTSLVGWEPPNAPALWTRL